MCLCAPAQVSNIEYPGDLHGFLSDKQNVFSLERQFEVIVEFNDGEREEDPGQARISGMCTVRNQAISPNYSME